MMNVIKVLMIIWPLTGIREIFSEEGTFELGFEV